MKRLIATIVLVGAAAACAPLPAQTKPVEKSAGPRAGGLRSRSVRPGGAAGRGRGRVPQGVGRDRRGGRRRARDSGPRRRAVETPQYRPGSLAHTPAARAGRPLGTRHRRHGRRRPRRHAQGHRPPDHRPGDQPRARSAARPEPAVLGQIPGRFAAKHHPARIDQLPRLDPGGRCSRGRPAVLRGHDPRPLSGRVPGRFRLPARRLAAVCQVAGLRQGKEVSGTSSPTAPPPFAKASSWATRTTSTCSTWRPIRTTRTRHSTCCMWRAQLFPGRQLHVLRAASITWATTTRPAATRTASSTRPS